MASKELFYRVELEDTIIGDIYATFLAYAEKCDYGVARSPIWWEIDPSSIELEDIEIISSNRSKVYTAAEFSQAVGFDMANEIIDRLLELTSDDPDDWDTN